MDKQPRYGAVSTDKLVQFWFDYHYLPEKNVVMVDIEFVILNTISVCIVSLEDQKKLTGSDIRGYPNFKEAIELEELVKQWVDHIPSLPGLELANWMLIKDSFGDQMVVYLEKEKKDG